MEEKDEITQNHEETKEEKPDKQDETNEEDKVIPILEANESLEDTNGDEISVRKQRLEAGKVGGSQLDSSKKLKQGLKQNQKAIKLTVPQPFSLATEKRMSRERRGSMDLRDSKPILSKSASFNYKVNAQSSLGAEGTSNQRRVDKRIENGPKTKDKIQVKEVEPKKAQVNAKEREELKMSKLGKSSTFKASPLPSFYRRKDPPPKPEIKKIPVTRPKSPLLGQRSKSMPNSEHKKTEDKGKGVSRIISSSAKEAISKLLRTTRKSTNNQKVTVMKGTVISTA